MSPLLTRGIPFTNSPEIQMGQNKIMSEAYSNVFYDLFSDE